MKKFFLFVLIGLSLIQMACGKSDKSGEVGIQQIMLSSKPPVGVVFEIASGDDEGLKWALPLVQSHAKQLREKFPGIELAMVFHGEEQFQLTKDSSQYFPDAHKQIKSLINDQDIDVHVCGNYAASFGVEEDDFVDYIDVASSGPAQVKSYEKDGYVVLFIRQPTEKSIN
jgi:intracellular sulfur oxidation DsrE/DsrF family protein